MASSVIKFDNPFNTGDYVDLSNYKSSNPYIFPSDGYVFIFNPQSGAYAVVHGGEYQTDMAIGTPNGRNMVYVRKGMQAYTTTGTFGAVRFIPFV